VKDKCEDADYIAPSRAPWTAFSCLFVSLVSASPASIETSSTSRIMWISSVATVTALAAFASAQLENAYSPPRYPSPWARGGNDWQDAYAKAQAFVSQLTLLEKVNLTTGVGWEGQACVGTTGSIPRLNFAGLCLQDSPLGVRDSKFWSTSMHVLIADILCSRF